MTPERVLTAMESGPMLSMAQGRTGVERRAIAEFVTGKPFAEAFSTKPSPQAMCRQEVSSQPADRAALERLGREHAEHALSGSAMAGLAAADVPSLNVKWAFGFPGELSADGQPSIAGGRVFVGTQSGTVYALSAATGCVHWTFTADAAVRAAITIAAARVGESLVAFVGDRAGTSTPSTRPPER